jgi:hypothetical protein
MRQAIDRVRSDLMLERALGGSRNHQVRFHMRELTQELSDTYGYRSA